MTMENRYKLQISFEVTKVNVDPDYPDSEQYTGERLNLQSNLNLGSAKALTEVLSLIQSVQDLAESKLHVREENR